MSRFGEKVLAKQISTTPHEQERIPAASFGIWLGVRNNIAECFIGNADGVLRDREIRRLELKSRRDKEAINNEIGVPWRMTDGRWTVDRPEVRVDPIPILPLPFEGARIHRKSPSKTSTNLEPRLAAQVAMQSRTTNCASPLRSLQSTNRRMSQNNSTWSRKSGSKK